MLFAPKFDHFGCDVARAFLAKSGGGRVHGLCTGPPEVRDHVATELSEFGGQFWRLEDEEAKWLSTPVSLDELKRLDRELGSGGFGRVVTADRRIGLGFVRGGLTRPNRIARLAARDSRASSQRYVYRLHRFLNTVLNETQPEVVFYYAVIDAPALAMAELCQVRDIPFCKLTHTRLGDRYIVDPDTMGRHENVGRVFEKMRDSRSVYPRSVMKEAQDYLAAFRERPTSPSYSQWASWYTQPRSVAQGGIRAFWFVFFTFAHFVREIYRGRWPGVDMAWQALKVWIVWRRQWVGCRYFSSTNDLPEEFIFFPLHVTPEASTLVLSPWHTDQMAVIEALAKAAPAHLQIVVKEHMPMLGRRPTGFYRQLARIPRVMLLGADHSSFDLIHKAQLTAVITGTAAWEAILLRRPALVIGESPFLRLGEGIVYERDLTRLPGAIREALSLSPATDDTLALYIAATLSESFSMSSSLLWATYSAHSPDERHVATHAIASAIWRTMSEFYN